MQKRLRYNQIVDMFNASPDTKIPGYDIICYGHKPGKAHKVLCDFKIKSDLDELYEHAFHIEYDRYYYVPYYDLPLGSIEPGTTVILHTVESIENFVISCDCEIKELKDVIERITETKRGCITRRDDDLGNIEISTDSSILTLLSTRLEAEFPTSSDSAKNDDNSYRYTIMFDAFTITYV